MATFTLFDRRQRDAGTLVSPSVDVRLLPKAIFRLRGLLTAGDIADPALRIRWAIEGSRDPAGLSWTPLVSGLWHGGFVDDTGQGIAPQITYQASDLGLMQRVRLVMDFPKRLSIGGEVEVL